MTKNHAQHHSVARSHFAVLRLLLLASVLVVPARCSTPAAPCPQSCDHDLDQCSGANPDHCPTLYGDCMLSCALVGYSM